MITGKGWLLRTISCLALGIDPRDTDGCNSMTLGEILASIRCLHSWGFSLDTISEHGLRIEFSSERAQYFSLAIGLVGNEKPTFEIRWEQKIGGGRLRSGGLYGANPSIANWLTRDDIVDEWEILSETSWRN